MEFLNYLIWMPLCKNPARSRGITWGVSGACYSQAHLGGNHWIDIKTSEAKRVHVSVSPFYDCLTDYVHTIHLVRICNWVGRALLLWLDYHDSYLGYWADMICYLQLNETGLISSIEFLHLSPSYIFYSRWPASFLLAL